MLLFQSISGTIQIHEMTVYDRWGTRVYSNKAPQVNNKLDGWNGTKNGQPVPSGTYIYSLALEYANGEKDNIVGSVFLVN